MSFAKDEGELAERVSHYLKARIAVAGLTYAELAERMKRFGRPNESASSIKLKLHRGTFSATFFVAAIAALDQKVVALKDI